MKLLKAGVLSALMLAAQPVVADTKIIFNNFLSPDDALWTDVLVPWIADVERVTEGRVTFTVPASSLAPPPGLLNAVQQGVVDGAFQMVGFLRESNPELQMPMLPMTYFGNEETSVALWRTYEKFFQGKNDLPGVKTLALITTPGASLFNMKDQPIQSMADMQGLKIWTVPGITADLLSALGAVATPGPAVRMYEVISGGIVDAYCCINFESLEVFNVSQYLGATTEIPGRLFAPAFAVFLKNDIWDSISPEDQAAIMEVSGETFAHRGSFGDPKEAEARQRAMDRGIPVEQASDEFVAEIEAAFEPILEAWYAEVEKVGIDGKAALEYYLAEQDKIEAGN